MSADFHFETARPADFAEIAALVNSAYRGESGRAGWTHESDYFTSPRIDVAGLEKNLSGANPAKILYLREKNSGAMRACVFLEKIGGGDKAAHCYLGLLTVSPTLQDRGLGRLILDRAEQEARAWNADRLVMRVLSPRSELIAWYERRGYRRTGETLPFHDKALLTVPDPDAIHFVSLEKIL